VFEARDQRAAPLAARGTMLWFNVDKGHGFIESDGGERIYVDLNGFGEGAEPAPRCKGREVLFELVEGDQGMQAVNVRYVEPMEQRRARLRRAR
jgi:cold shock protein